MGTATFRDPHAPWQVLRQLARWCREHDTTVADIRRAERAPARTMPDRNRTTDQEQNVKEDAHG